MDFSYVKRGNNNYNFKDVTVYFRLLLKRNLTIIENQIDKNWLEAKSVRKLQKSAFGKDRNARICVQQV